MKKAIINIQEQSLLSPSYQGYVLETTDEKYIPCLKLSNKIVILSYEFKTITLTSSIEKIKLSNVLYSTDPKVALSASLSFQLYYFEHLLNSDEISSQIENLNLEWINSYNSNSNLKTIQVKSSKKIKSELNSFLKRTIKSHKLRFYTGDC